MTLAVRRAAAAFTVALVAPTLITTTVGPTITATGAAAAAAAAVSQDGRGTWHVADAGDGTWQVSWRSPTRLPVTSDRPTITATEGVVGVSTIVADGRTVTATVRAESAPDPATLDVLLSGDRLDATGRDQATTSTVRAQAPVTGADVADPGLPGPHAVVTSDYELDPVPFSGFKEPIEMVGHVVEPAPDAATGPRPLVLFLHGRHTYCYLPEGERGDEWTWPCVAPALEIPSHLGYHYLQRLLASQGYTTVSIRVNGINAQDWRALDGGASARATVIRAHLDHWTTLSVDHQVDLSRVVLVGHSRGGEGVNRTSIRVPLSAPYRIVGQVLVAPTDFGSQTAPYVPTVTLLPYCDGDVIDLQGQRYTDVARDVVRDDPSLKSSVMVMGANHNFFNTEWTPGLSQAPSWDDWFGEPDQACGRATEDRLSAGEQRKVGKAYVAGAVRLFANDAQEFLPMYDGSRVVPISAGNVDVRTHSLGGDRILRRPSLDTDLTLPTGAETQFCRGRTDYLGAPDVCGRTTRDPFAAPHWAPPFDLAPTRKEFEMRWTAAGQTGGMSFRTPLDLTERRLELRTIVDPAFGNVRFRVRLSDTDGASAIVTPEGGGFLPVLLRGGFGLGKRWAQPVLVDPSAAPIDLSRVRSLELVGDSADGRVWVLDVSAAARILPAVPVTRAPQVNLRRVVLDEGSGGLHTARVPFTISSPLTRPARLTMVTVNVDGPRGGVDRFTVDLAPGQTAGSIPVGYEADRLDDPSRTTYVVAAYVGRNVMTDRYLGGLVIEDDDPTPTVTVQVVDRPAVEGEAMVFRVRLSERVDYPVWVSGRVIAGPTPAVRTGDVGARWLRRHTFGKVGDPATPLHRLRTILWGQIRPGQRVADIRIPIRRDGLTEPRESLSVRLRALGQRVEATGWVARS